MDALWAQQPVLTIDGGLGTEIDRRGVNISNDPLWSAKLLSTNPELLQKIHLDYLQAGADVIITATYHASMKTFCRLLKVSEQEACDLLRKAVRLAKEARDEFMRSNPNSLQPLIAGSVGPFAVSFFNASEYHGNYVEEVSVEEMMDWHRPRIKCLVEEGVDILAIETIAAKAEADAIIQVLKEFPTAKAWITFTCKNSQETGHGESFADVVCSVAQHDQIVAVGVNCLAPQHVEGLLRSVQGVTEKPLIVYPNSGEEWVKSEWVGKKVTDSLASYVPKWILAGAKAIGGCCHTGPEDVTAIRRAITEYFKTNVTSQGGSPSVH